MCGIVGIVGKEVVAQRLFDGLKRLEYRGYDSAGICTIDEGELVRRRAEGKLDNLARELSREPLGGTIGIAHTRWATHGAPTVDNAHPHIVGPVAIVHNGIIENYLGSDALAVAPWTQRIAYLDEGDWAIVHRDRIQIFDRENEPVEREIVESGASAAAVEKGNYRHYMQKEIFEQPIVVAQTLQSYVRPFEGEVALPTGDLDLSAIGRVTIVACGTSFYAGMVAKYWFEQFARVPVDIDVASEFRYRQPVL